MMLGQLLPDVARTGEDDEKSWITDSLTVAARNPYYSETDLDAARTSACATMVDEV
jgi:hypothetical protein